MKKIIRKLDASIQNLYIRANRPLLPVSKYIRKPMRLFFHQSPYLRHDSRLYLKPLLLDRFHRLFVGEHPKDFTIYKNQIKFRSYGGAMSIQAYYVGEIEYHLVQYLVRQICPDFVMIDIGGHHGAYSLIVAYELRKRGWKGLIHCFEADPNNCELIKYNFQQNNLEEYIIIHNKAVADFVGRKKFLFHKDNSSGYLIDNNYHEPNARVEDVEVTKIDEMIDILSNVKLIKMDIQGGESSALIGAEQLINRNKPILLVEAVPTWDSTKKTKEILEKQNYFLHGVNKYGELCDLESPKVYVSWDLVALAIKQSKV